MINIFIVLAMAAFAWMPTLLVLSWLFGIMFLTSLYFMVKAFGALIMIVVGMFVLMSIAMPSRRTSVVWFYIPPPRD